MLILKCQLVSNMKQCVQIDINSVLFFSYVYNKHVNGLLSKETSRMSDVVFKNKYHGMVTVNGVG